MASIRTIRYVRKTHYRRALLASSLWRDNFSIANAFALPQPTPRLSDFRLVEDRRTFSPGHRYRTSYGGRARVVRNPKVNRTRVYTRSLKNARFSSPSTVLVCIRRKQRAEVMHALGRAGRRGQRRPKFSETSKIYC